MSFVLIVFLIFLALAGALGAVAYFTYQKKLRRAKAIERGLKMVPILIHLPPPSSDTQAGNRDVKEVMREKTAQAEVLYNLLAGTATEGFKSNFFGQRHVALELIVVDGLVHFYAAVPVALVSVAKKAIQTAYPGARMEEVEDHNIFNQQGRLAATLGGEMVLRTDSSYPIATYEQLDRDPLEALLTTVSALEKQDGVAVQIMLRPAGPGWIKHAVTVADSLRKGKNADLKFTAMDLAKAAMKAPSAAREEERAKTGGPDVSNLKLSQVERVEEKTKHPGFEVLIRVIVSTGSVARSQQLLRDMATSFALYEAPGLNGFKFLPAVDVQGLVTAFIFRFFPPELKGSVLNSVELATLFHLPDSQFTPSASVERQQSKQVDGPVQLPTVGLLFGYNEFRGAKKEIRLSAEDRRRHTYILGQTGTGKSTMLENLAVQDMLAGNGFAFIDPHGDSAEKLLALVPKERAEDVIYFNPADTQYPLGLNLFEFTDPTQKDFIVQETINMLYKLYDPGHTGIIGPRYEHWYRNAALTLMSDPGGSTFIEIPKVFTDTDYLKTKFKYLKDPTVIDFWTKEMGQTSDYHKSEMLGWFVSKFGAFQNNEMMRNIIGQTKSSFNLRDVMDGKKILIVNLSKGRIGELNSQLLGMIFVIKFQAAAMSRADMLEDQRSDFALYVDEFQNFSTDSFASILSEARKYRLNLIVANQFIGQLSPEIRDAVFGNIGTIVAHRMGPEDAEFMVKQFAPIFEAGDLVNIPNFNAVMRLMIGGLPSQPFTIHDSAPLGTANIELGLAVKQLSAAKYGHDKHVVEADILSRLGGGAPVPSSGAPVGGAVPGGTPPAGAPAGGMAPGGLPGGTPPPDVPVDPQPVQPVAPSMVSAAGVGAAPGAPGAVPQVPSAALGQGAPMPAASIPAATVPMSAGASMAQPGAASIPQVPMGGGSPAPGVGQTVQPATPATVPAPVSAMPVAPSAGVPGVAPVPAAPPVPVAIPSMADITSVATAGAVAPMPAVPAGAGIGDDMLMAAQNSDAMIQALTGNSSQSVAPSAQAAGFAQYGPVGVAQPVPPIGAPPVGVPPIGAAPMPAGANLSAVPAPTVVGSAVDGLVAPPPIGAPPVALPATAPRPGAGRPPAGRDTLSVSDITGGRQLPRANAAREIPLLAEPMDAAPREDDPYANIDVLAAPPPAAMQARSRAGASTVDAAYPPTNEPLPSDPYADIDVLAAPAPALPAQSRGARNPEAGDFGGAPQAGDAYADVPLVAAPAPAMPEESLDAAPQMTVVQPPPAPVQEPVDLIYPVAPRRGPSQITPRRQPQQARPEPAVVPEPAQVVETSQEVAPVPVQLSEPVQLEYAPETAANAPQLSSAPADAMSADPNANSGNARYVGGSLPGDEPAPMTPEPQPMSADILRAQPDAARRGQVSAGAIEREAVQDVPPMPEPEPRVQQMAPEAMDAPEVSQAQPVAPEPELPAEPLIHFVDPAAESLLNQPEPQPETADGKPSLSGLPAGVALVDANAQGAGAGAPMPVAPVVAPAPTPTPTPLPPEQVALASQLSSGELPVAPAAPANPGSTLSNQQATGPSAAGAPALQPAPAAPAPAIELESVAEQIGAVPTHDEASGPKVVAPEAAGAPGPVGAPALKNEVVKNQSTPAQPPAPPVTVAPVASVTQSASSPEPSAAGEKKEGGAEKLSPPAAKAPEIVTQKPVSDAQVPVNIVLPEAKPETTPEVKAEPAQPMDAQQVVQSSQPTETPAAQIERAEHKIDDLLSVSLIQSEGGSAHHRLPEMAQPAPAENETGVDLELNTARAAGSAKPAGAGDPRPTAEHHGLKVIQPLEPIVPAKERFAKELAELSGQVNAPGTGGLMPAPGAGAVPAAPAAKAAQPASPAAPPASTPPTPEPAKPAVPITLAPAPKPAEKPKAFVPVVEAKPTLPVPDLPVVEPHPQEIQQAVTTPAQPLPEEDFGLPQAVSLAADDVAKAKAAAPAPVEPPAEEMPREQAADAASTTKAETNETEKPAEIAKQPEPREAAQKAESEAVHPKRHRLGERKDKPAEVIESTEEAEHNTPTAAAAEAAPQMGKLILPTGEKPKPEAPAPQPDKPKKLAPGEVFVDEHGNVMVGE